MFPASVAIASDLVFEDGFDVPLQAAFFVSTQGLDSDPGSKAQPFRTITHAIAAAAADPVRKTVVVALGTYAESVSLVSGVSLFGQYQDGTWTRDPSNDTIIHGAAAFDAHLHTVTAQSIAAATTLDGFVIYGAANATPGGNSYAVYIADSGANLKITNNVIFGGRGGPGAAGSPGTNGSTGSDGAAGADSFLYSGSGLCAANGTTVRPSSGGGTNSCNGTVVNGGNGGGNECVPVPNTQHSGFAGSAGSGTGAGGNGVPGYDADLQNVGCVMPHDAGSNPYPIAGTDGAGGSAGTSGNGVAGCTAGAGNVVAGDWIGDDGSPGFDGAAGSGGGGGGAGGGAKCSQSIAGACTKDSLGGHGGGGGSGGCGGIGGGAGGGGGGAFDVFIVGGAAPVLYGNTLFLGDGGDGGSGGDGGIGGFGGSGSPGGQVSSAAFCSGAGGQGAGGGAGGHGSGGGGGCGGTSVGIYSHGVGAPDYCASGRNASYGGFAGAGGAGGSSFVNPGGAGHSGVLAACSFN